MWIYVRQHPKEKAAVDSNLIHSTSLYMKAVRLTYLVPPFYGEFHQQLLGIGADEDEWGCRLVAGIRELRR